MRKLPLLLLLFSPFVAHASIANIYYAATSAGSNNGTDCADAYAYSDATNGFNVSGKWGAGSTQIGPGTTAHLCGTFTDAIAGDTLLTFQASGSVGNPITLKFETGAILTNTAYFNGNGSCGAICGNGASYIVVDGGTNGEIQNTGNGSLVSQGGTFPYNQDSSCFVDYNGSGGTSVTVQNLFCHNMRQHTAFGDTTGWNYSYNILIRGMDQVLITHNTLDNNVAGVFFIEEGASQKYEASFNTISSCNWGVAGGPNGVNNTGTTIHDNDISGGVNWDDSADTHHHSWIYIFTQAGNSLTHPLVYNNYGHGDLGVNNTTGFGLINGGSTPITDAWMFNNVLAPINHVCDNNCLEAITDHAHILENTMVGSTTTGSLGAFQTASTNGIIEGNIASTTPTGIQINTGDALGTSDYNVFYTLGANAMIYGAAYYSTVAAWTSGTGFDAHSRITNPNLNLSTFTINSGSSAIGLVPNMTSSCSTVPQLCNDKNGTARPAMGNWDAGAYQFNSTPPVITNPSPAINQFTRAVAPTNLLAKVAP